MQRLLTMFIARHVTLAQILMVAIRSLAVGRDHGYQLTHNFFFSISAFFTYQTLKPLRIYSWRKKTETNR